MNKNDYCGNYNRGGKIGMNYGQKQYKSGNNMQSPRKHPSLEPSSPSDLHQPFLSFRKESENSSEGNTIDMVKLERRKEEGRVTKVNNYRQFYNKYSHGNSIENANRYNRDINNAKDESVCSPQANPYGNKSFRQYSASERLVLQSSQKSFFRSPFRPSQMNLLQEMDGSARNRVIGWLLMVVFIIVYLQFVILCGVVLNEGYLSYGNNETSPSLSESLQPISLFTTALFVYSLSQCLYHLSIYIIHSKTNNQNKNGSLLIDTQSASLRYILKCRDFTSQSTSLIQRIIKSPKFTFIIIIISTILLAYGTVECFYHSELTLLYDSGSQGQKQDYSFTYSLLQVVFFLIIIPDVMSFVFFQQMHLARHKYERNSVNSRRSENKLGFNHNYNQNQPNTSPFNLNQNIISQQHNNHHYIKQDSFNMPPLTVFNLHSWWVKMSLVIFLISIVYSLISGKWWLGVIVFAKIELCFLKNKYRIDLFWVQLMSKGLIVIVSGFLLLYEWWGNIVMNQNLINEESTIYNGNNIGYSGSNFITFSKFFLAAITITIAILLSRLLASHYLREQLYKHLFQQMQILSSTIIGSLLIIYLLYQYILLTLPINYISVLFIIMMKIGLLVSVCIQGKQRQQIDLYIAENQSQNCQIQMQHYQI